MATNRFQFSDDFVLKNGRVGINTADPQAELDVRGTIKADNLTVTGVATFTSYEGFLRSDYNIDESLTITNGSALSGEIIVGTGKTVTIANLPFGPELITNGSFISTTSGWTAYNAVISISNEQLKVDDSANAGSWSSAVQEVNTEPGVKYRLEVGIGTETEGSIYGYYNGRYPSAGTAPYYQSPRYDPVGIVTDVYEFIATEKITSIILTANNDGISHFDNVSLKKINVPEESRAGGSQIECMKVFNTFTPPNGGTNERPYAPKPGQLYYNYDFKTIEFFDGNGWRQVDNTTRSGRGVFGGGSNPSLSPVYPIEIDFVNIQSLGNAQDFGDLTIARTNHGSCSSEIRGIFAAGNDASYTDRIDYITIASQGNAIDFGNVSTTNRSYVSCCSSSTRGLFNGGYTPTPSNQTVNVIDRIEISTLGDAVDFGDLFHYVYAAASTSSTTRAIVAGGVGTPALGTNPSTRFGQVQKYEIGSGGTSIDFGQLSVARWNVNGMSNGTRGVFGGGQVPTYFSMIDYVTIASEGNSLQFGELSTIRDGVGATSDRTRGLFAGGRETVSPGNNGINVIEYITMASLGNPVDFGDLTVPRYRLAGLSDSHGGLGGF